MDEYVIGKVIGVTGDIEFGVLDSMTVHLSTATGPAPVLIGQPGTFLTVALPAGKLLCMVTGIEMHESRVVPSEAREIAAEGAVPLDRVTRSLTTIPVGTIDASGNFERGTDVLPTVNAPVFGVPPQLIDNVYRAYADGDFAIGKLSLLPEQQAKINLDAFLTRHAAILGQTGAGKSWAVASIVQKICAFRQATIVLFDLHGEYGSAFATSAADLIMASDLELPYWLMNSEELLGLMVDRSEAAAPNQIAKFKELLQAAKESHPENQKPGIKKITIDTPVFV